MTMTQTLPVHIDLTDGPLPPAAAWLPHGAGAIVCFEGVVRLMEDHRPLEALDYQQYPPMTERELASLAEATLRQHALTAVWVEHSVGRVPVGECSFRLRVASPHRKAALAACDAFIDAMKQSVPLWKLPLWSNA